MKNLRRGRAAVILFPALRQCSNVVRNSLLQMSTVDKFIETFLPPQTFQHRKDGPYLDQIDSLSSSEKIEFEEKLIDRVNSKIFDSWVVEALTYLKSFKSLPSLYNLLSKTKEKNARIIIASSIYQIHPDITMCDIIFEESKSIKDKYALIGLFYFMARVNDERLNAFIRQFHEDPDLLLSYNSKQWVK